MTWLGTCAVCRRRHDNVGYAPSEKHAMKWACLECATACAIEGDPTTNIVRKLYHMPKKQLDIYELKAVEAGGEAAGSYLDDLGRTDLAALELHEWTEFLRRFLNGYGESMRTMLKNNEAPF